MKNLLVSLLFVGSIFGQVVAKAPVPPTPAQPGQATLTSGGLVITVTGDAVPATKVVFVIKLAGNQIANWTQNISDFRGEDNSFALNSQVVHWVINGTTGAWTGTALVNGTTQSGGGNF